MGYQPMLDHSVPHLDRVIMTKGDVVVKLCNSDSEYRVLDFYAGYKQAGEIITMGSVLHEVMPITTKSTEQVESSMRWLEGKRQRAVWDSLTKGMIVKDTEGLNRKRVPLLNDDHYKTFPMWGGALRSRYLRKSVRQSWENLAQTCLPRLVALRLADDLIYNDEIRFTWLLKVESPRHSFDRSTWSVELVPVNMPTAAIKVTIDNSPYAEIAEAESTLFRYMWVG